MQKHGAQRIAFLMDYSKTAGNLVWHRWIELGNELVTKYNDGYIKEGRHINAVPYPKGWREEIIRQNPQKHKIIKWK